MSKVVTGHHTIPPMDRSKDAYEISETFLNTSLFTRAYPVLQLNYNTNSRYEISSECSVQYLNR